MITEDYVSFETAKLLKEKGVNEDSWFHYDADGDIVTRGYRLNMPEDIPAWTLQMAMKWLREKHLIFFDIFHINGDIEDGEEFQIGIYEKTSMDTYTWKNWIKGETYEKTYEKAIKYCLEKLI